MKLSEMTLDQANEFIQTCSPKEFAVEMMLVTLDQAVQSRAQLAAMMQANIKLSKEKEEEIFNGRSRREVFEDASKLVDKLTETINWIKEQQ